MDFAQENFKSWSVHMVGASTHVTDIPIGSKIISIDFLQSGTASNTWFECGGMQLSRNFARDASVQLAFTSTTTCTAVKTGNDESFVTVVYSTSKTIPTINTSTTTDNFPIGATVAPFFAYFAFLATFVVIIWIARKRQQDVPKT